MSDGFCLTDVIELVRLMGINGRAMRSERGAGGDERRREGKFSVVGWCVQRVKRAGKFWGRDGGLSDG